MFRDKNTIFFLTYFAMHFAVFSNEPPFAAKYRLVWLSQPFEVEWYEEILSKLDYDTVTYEMANNQPENFYADNSICIVSYPADHPSNKSYLEKLSENGFKFGIILTGDELNRISIDEFQNASFVIRNYWMKHHSRRLNALPIPLGYSRDFWKDCNDRSLKPVNERRYTWVFMGGRKSNREELFRQLRCIPNGHLLETGSFAGGYPKSEYREYMRNAIFAPAPRGWWNLESFRLYEALECGTIPIIETTPIDYHSLILGDYPFPAVRNWEELPKLIANLLADPQRLEELQSKCVSWWKRYKEELKTRIKDFIDFHMNCNNKNEMNGT